MSRRKHLRTTGAVAVVSVLLLTAVLAMAKSSRVNHSQIAKVASANAAQKSLNGCLSYADGTYSLTDSLGRTWQLEGNTEQLKNEVGHTVALTGTGTNAAVLTGNSREYIDVDMASVNDFQVSSVKQISATCSQRNERYAQQEANDMLAAG